ncbi:DNA-3-methyladenine glycosylase I [Pleionea litopenaei]|uniref:DNA-3-methyladenine glycosylase I n=1 Tax=Pleionea litopenaei TaxID=3070815 RepID=A0AA51RR95_9GAMM|nr:DNA-3-methyladenine glycosylase I [Pleionea sp. HL-JVS1]WMS86054.1 DNA-3-methyladenine glycosylase I [Pleionea sp. HL-JVS1]
MTLEGLTRCHWCGDDSLYVDYHDNEWGIAVYDDQRLFECLCLEGAQAGLSWITVLRKREQYRKVYHQFNIEAVSQMSDEELEEILKDPGVIRNRLKVYGFRKNAQALLNNFADKGAFSQYLWSFVEGKTIVNRYKQGQSYPTTSTQSDAMSKALKKLGFTFVGSTICYAFMQAVGMVDDHAPDCFRAK